MVYINLSFVNNMKILSKILLLLVVISFISCGEDEVPVNDDVSSDFQSVIDSIAPAEYEAGDTVTVYGTKFGMAPNGLSIFFEGGDEGGFTVADDILDWQNDQITFVVPEADLTGNLHISKKMSNSYSYKMGEPFFFFLIKFHARFR